MYDIRKVTGIADGIVDCKSATDSSQEGVRPNKVKQLTLKDGDIKEKLDLLDTIVSHNYLTTLEKSKIEKCSGKETGMDFYKITRIVIDKGVFFPDQLSMLYTALHDVAKNVVLVVDKKKDKKGHNDIEIYLGVRDFTGDEHEASRLLDNAMKGYLPGVKSDYEGNKKFFQEDKNHFVATYSGVASLRDDKKDNFVQGIEKFIDATLAIPKFTAMFIADNVSQAKTQNMIKAYCALQDTISPFAQWQNSFSESETKGVSNTLTKTIGETITNSLSETVTHTEGTNESYSQGESKSHSSNWNTMAGGGFGPVYAGGSYGGSDTIGQQYTQQSGKHSDNSNSYGKGSSEANQHSKSEASGTNESRTSGMTRQVIFSNAYIKKEIELLERHTKRLTNGIPFGLWSVGTYFISPKESTSRELAHIYKGCVTGEGSDLDVSAVNVWDKEKSDFLLEYLRDMRNPRFCVEGIDVSAGVTVTSKELAVQMSLPQSSVPGVEVRECATFGRNINGKRDDESNERESMRIGVVTHLGEKSKKEVRLDIEELSKHVFVTGSTGSGKSNAVYLLIDEFLKQNKSVLIVEPTKGDYRKVFGGRKDVTVYTTRCNEKHLLRINPFAFPKGVQVIEHVERLVEIFGVCWPMYAAMPAVLKNSILSAYEACGWDLTKSVCRFERQMFPTIADVVLQLKRIISSSQYSADTKGDYVGALQTRLESLTNGVYSSILSSSSMSYEELYDKNVIVDLHYIASSETRSLLMALIVLGLTEWRMSQNEDDKDVALKHVTVLEEAHCILPCVSKQQNQEGANMQGKSVEMIASAIAEMRTYGESFVIVDQSPNAVDEAAIRNTNTKIVMNLPDGNDRDIAGRSVALTKDEQIAEIARLTTGEAIVWQRGWSEAVFTTIDEMQEENIKPLLHRDNLADDDSKPYKPSAIFIDFFLEHKMNIDATLLDKLRNEIFVSDCATGAKAKLIDAINTKKVDIATNRAVVEYLGINDEIRRLEKSSEDLLEIQWNLRRYMSEQLGVYWEQNKLLKLVNF